MEKEWLNQKEEMERILREAWVGELALSRDGEPYVVPINFTYHAGHIYFHCAFEGKKLDFLRRNPRVCFSVARDYQIPEPHPPGVSCRTNYESVLCYGTAREVSDIAERKRILDIFVKKFRDEEVPLERVRNCNAVDMTIEEMTGRRQKDQDRIYWRHRF